MEASARPSLFWFRWLIAVTIGLMVFGLSMVLAPGFTRESFGLVLYAATDHMATFGAEAVAYISLVHAVLGAVMFGWGVALLFVVCGPFGRGSREGWRILAVSVAAWFVPDTAFSLWSGFRENAVLNLVLVVLFAVPLVATYRVFNETRA